MRVLTTSTFSIDIDFEKAMDLYLSVRIPEFKERYLPTFSEAFVNRLIEILDDACTNLNNDD